MPGLRAPGSAVSGFRGFRWTICALLFAATTVNYMDRQVLGILAPTLEKAIGWNETQLQQHRGRRFRRRTRWVLRGFGRLMDRMGTRRGYPVAVGMWSLACMAHALARSVFGFGVARFALGIGEGGNFPAAVKAVAEWFPRRERALATGLFNSGSSVGRLWRRCWCPGQRCANGWQACFLLLGTINSLWIGAWLWLYQTPAKSGPRFSR